MSTCIRCGKKLPWGARFCAYCGARQPAVMAQLFRRVDWRFFGRWLIVTGLSWAVAWLALTNPLLWGAGTSAGAGLDNASLLPIALAGLMIAAGQWLVLWVRPARSGKAGRAPEWRGWILAVPAGWLLGSYLVILFSGAAAADSGLLEAGKRVIPGLLLGAIAAAAQWPVARHYAWPARGWLLAPGVACALALAVAAAGPALEGGWVGHVAFGLPGDAAFSSADLWLAALCGGLIGLGQLPLIWRTVRARYLWPVLSMAGFVAGVLAADGIAYLFAASGVAAAAGTTVGTGLLVSAPLAANPLAAAAAWGAAGIGLAGGQRLLVRISPPTPGRAAVAEGAARDWAPLAAVGWAAGGAGASLLASTGWALPGGLAAGLLAGIPLWLAVPRGRETAAWLPVANAVAWAVATAAAPLVTPLGPSFPLGLMLLTLLLAIVPGGVLALER